MLLTIVLTLDVEKPPEYDELFFTAAEWSAGTAIDDVHIVTISQRDSLEPVYAHVSRCPRNSDGYPVWDLFADVREVWHHIQGQYVTFAHTEYCWGPDRLRRTLQALEQEQPVLALGNLRRTRPASMRLAARSADNPLSKLLAHWVATGDTDNIATWWECFTAYPWITDQVAAGPSEWCEDVFFARRDWLEAIGFFNHGGRMPFQDVYDVMGCCIQLLERHGASPPIIRFDREVCELVHLAHAKYWSAYSPATRDWFFERRGDWANTTFVRDDLWRRVLNSRYPGSVVRDFRRAPGGTVTNWHSGFSGWLQNGGEDKVLTWLDQSACSSPAWG